MGRDLKRKAAKERKKQDKAAEERMRKVLTDEQFKQLTQAMTHDAIINGVIAVWNNAALELVKIMREHRISEDRIYSITSAFDERLDEKYSKDPINVVNILKEADKCKR